MKTLNTTKFESAHTITSYEMDFESAVLNVTIPSDDEFFVFTYGETDEITLDGETYYIVSFANSDALGMVIVERDANGEQFAISPFDLARFAECF